MNTTNIFLQWLLNGPSYARNVHEEIDSFKCPICDNISLKNHPVQLEKRHGLL